MKLSACFTTFVAIATVFVAVSAEDCADDSACIRENYSCMGREDDCCEEEDEDMGCYGFSFFKTCQETPTCLEKYMACNTDGHSIGCCDDLVCSITESGLNQCLPLTPETRFAPLPEIDIEDEEDDPVIDLPTRNLETTPKPDPMEYWMGCIKGDPHITTMDNLKFDCQGVGEFVAVKSMKTQRQIQTRFKRFKGGDLSVTTGLVVQDEGDTPKVQLQAPVNPKDGFTTNIGSGCHLQLFINDEQKDLAEGYADDKVQVEYNKNSVTIKYLESEMWLDVSVKPSICRFSTCWYIPKGDDSLIGLTGSPDENVENDWMDKTGKLIDFDISQIKQDSYSYDYCVKNWCLESREESLFKYNEAGVDFDFYDECDAPFGVALSEYLDLATPELIQECKNDEQCIIDGIFEGGDVRNFFFNEKEAKKQVRGKNAECDPGVCKDHLTCYPFGGLYGSRCVKKEPECHPKKASCGGDKECCGDLECREFDDGPRCAKKKKNQCFKNKAACTDDAECCSKQCWGVNGEQKQCVKGDKAGNKQKCAADRPCKDDLTCIDNICKKVSKVIKKQGAGCLGGDLLGLNRDCKEGLICVPELLKCAMLKNGEACAGKGANYCGDILPCCGKNHECVPTFEEHPLSKQLIPTGHQCRKQKKKKPRTVNLTYFNMQAGNY